MIVDPKARELFAIELDKFGEKSLAAMVRSGADNSHGGQAALGAIMRATDLERERCVAIVQGARFGELDRDWRSITTMIEGGRSADELVAEAKE